MSFRKLTLVHNSSWNNVPSSKEGSPSCFEQLDLFHSEDRDHLFVIHMNDINSHRFLELLAKELPASVIDTRKYPEFFGYFNSTHEALFHFKNSGIKYIHEPMSWADKDVSLSLMRILSEASDSCTTCKVFFLLVSAQHYKISVISNLNKLSEFGKEWRIHDAQFE